MDFLLTKLEFEDGVQKIEQIPQKRIVMCTQVIGFCQKILENYRRGIRLEVFGEISSEIQFFKEHKQHPQSYLIFYHKLLQYELAIPNQDEGSRRKYLLRKIKKVNKFFLSQIDFIQYLELGQTHMDEFYFTRKFNDKKIHSNRIYDRDPDFSTSHDILLARLKAYQKLLPFFHKQLALLDNPQGNFAFKHDLKWTSSKVALIELIYALHHSGAINNGSADIISIVTLLEEVFNLKLDNFYKKFADIKVRKGRRTKFLDELTWNFEQKLNQDEGL